MCVTERVHNVTIHKLCIQLVAILNAENLLEQMSVPAITK